MKDGTLIYFNDKQIGACAVFVATLTKQDIEFRVTTKETGEMIIEITGH